MASLMSYVLATTGSVVRWYRFDADERIKPSGFTLEVELDLRVVPQFSDKEAAKKAAQSLDLKTWRYVRV